MHYARPESCAQSDPQQIVVLPGDAKSFQILIYGRKETHDGFAIGKQVAVVVDEHGDFKLILQHGGKGYSTPECREVSAIANYPVGVIGGSGKGKADGHRLIA